MQLNSLCKLHAYIHSTTNKENSAKQSILRLIHHTWFSKTECIQFQNAGITGKYALPVQNDCQQP